MVTLVTGGSGSGKSEYGEQLIMESGAPLRYYIATMEVFGEEGRLKVARHRKLRAQKGFLTIEKKRDLHEISLPGEEKKAVLLECVSNLAANEMFCENASGGSELETFMPEALAEKLTDDISNLRKQADCLVIITNEVGADGREYDPSTAAYIRLLGEVNRRLARMADRVVEVVYGIPVVLKS
jgi:adenosylcobinamide kinase/adenosylcobinamide-phosphate guanylyltransferase